MLKTRCIITAFSARNTRYKNIYLLRLSLVSYFLLEFDSFPHHIGLFCAPRLGTSTLLGNYYHNSLIIDLLGCFARVRNIMISQENIVKLKAVFQNITITHGYNVLLFRVINNY